MTTTETTTTTTTTSKSTTTTTATSDSTTTTTTSETTTAKTTSSTSKTTATTTSGTTASSIPNSNVIGDINGDGMINLQDAIRVLQLLRPNNITVSKTSAQKGDTVTVEITFYGYHPSAAGAVDLTLMLQKILNQEKREQTYSP